MTQPTDNLESIVLGGGCFWCLEAVYQQVRGIEVVTSGYAGGTVPNPTYEQIETARTGHAQVVKLDFRPDVITFADILDVFWVVHNPTTLQRQDYDVGPQYRSIILYLDEAQKRTAEESRNSAQKLWPNPIVTEIVPLEHFYKAESYHQNYFRNHPEQAYCQIIINPKLKKLRDKFQTRLASDQ
ncbi:MAG TPA: peptide-methionine (S)-S-oxide reductase MsrA [Candidatus Saccharimonadia bacterium]|nr:peptide-methionine (S)-S-oxide reductase MsrA [Candidatus Saccharimonadia bacterium]